MASKDLTELKKLDGRPSWSSSFAHAMQHVLAMLVGNITPPIIIASTLGLTDEERIILIQAAMLIGGITTLVQTHTIMGFGMGLPNCMGVAFAYMPILLSIGVSYGIGAIFGAQLIAGALSIPLGMGIKKVRHLFPPIVSGTVVLCIGLSLYNTAMTYIG
ncbi:MAG TPA: solute carrier family 23 protein [Thermoclostridium sp.]|nr:solute carrier family 23 protein [Thermoclostridium sp.]